MPQVSENEMFLLFFQMCPPKSFFHSVYDFIPYEILHVNVILANNLQGVVSLITFVKKIFLARLCKQIIYFQDSARSLQGMHYTLRPCKILLRNQRDLQYLAKS